MSRRSVVVLGLAGALMFSRFWALAADPPAWMPGAWLVDSGWWANGARGAALFDDPGSEDHGMAALMVPGYTWALRLLFQVFDVDLIWAQALAAAANLLTIALVALLLWRKLSPRAAAWGVVLLGASPFYWAHARAALPESLQALLVVLAFTIWALAGHRRPAAFAGGLFMGAAIVVKLNAATLGLAPLLVAAGCVWWAHTQPQGGRSPVPAGMLLCSALGLAMAGVAAWTLVVRPDPGAFWTILGTESRSHSVDWMRMMTFPGYALISDGMVQDGRMAPILWKVARWSPGILLAMWLYLLDAVHEWYAAGSTALMRRSGFELVCTGWALVAWLAVIAGINQWEYRYILLLPLFALLGATYLSRSPRPADTRTLRRGWLARWLLWMAALLPLLILAKPWLTRCVMELTRDLQVAGRSGLGTGAAGTPVVVGWIALMAMLAWTRVPVERLAYLAFHRWMQVAVAAVVCAEAACVAFYLGASDDTLRRALPELHRHVVAGETVAGRLSATLFLNAPVHTVRTATSRDDPDEFDWDAVQRRWHPRYVILADTSAGATVFGYPALRDQLLGEGYRETHRFAIGPYSQASPRYSFVLLEH